MLILLFSLFLVASANASGCAPNQIWVQTSSSGGECSECTGTYPFAANWAQMGANIPVDVVQDKSGRSVSLSVDGMVMAIGAPGHDNDKGHVRVYHWDPSSSLDWIQIGSDIDGADTNDRSGQSVSLSADGTIVAIGAEFNNGDGADSK